MRGLHDDARANEALTVPTKETEMKKTIIAIVRLTVEDLSSERRAENAALTNSNAADLPDLACFDAITVAEVLNREEDDPELFAGTDMFVTMPKVEVLSAVYND